MAERDWQRVEGDVNLTPARRRWLAEQVDALTAEWLARDERRFLPQALSTPCLDVLVGCSGIFLEDARGRRIMDFHGNEVHQLGHRHPEVVAAVKNQLDTLPFCPRRYTNMPAVELAERLTSLAPAPLGRVLLAPGGTIAVSMALKIARAVTGRYKTLSMWESFHGATMDAISVGGEASFRRGLGPLLPGSEHVPPCAPAGCPFGCGRECSLRCLDLVEYVLEKDGEIGAVVLETIRNTDVYAPPPAYLRGLRALCDRHGALLVLDETAIALGRTGRWFAFEHAGVVPDVVTLGKGLGGGVMPLAAVVARDDLPVPAQMSIGHFTHEKNPIAAAAALAVLRCIERDRLLERAEALGAHLRERLLRLAARHEDVIKDVRGIGLLYAVALGGDPEFADRVLYAALERGLSFKVSQGNVALLVPPLIITEEQLDSAVGILEAAIAAARSEG